MGRNKSGYTRWQYKWVPDPDDEREYAWRNGYWEEIGFDDQEVDEDALEEHEERKRERIARANEY